MDSDSNIIPGLDDDEVIFWWELYDSGMSLDQVSTEAKIPIYILHAALGPKGLNVLGTSRLSDKDPQPAPLKLDQLVIWQAQTGNLSPADQALYEAIGKLGASTNPDGTIAHRHLSVANALPHQYPQNRGKHHYCPMSARQRALDRLALSRWRQLVRQDMRRSGLV